MVVYILTAGKKHLKMLTNKISVQAASNAVYQSVINALYYCVKMQNR